jgi:hypothetical protein
MTLTQALVAYLITAGTSWIGTGTNAAERVEVVQNAAEAVANVVVSEAPLFSNDNVRMKTGLVLMSTAGNESGFHPFVDAGLCNLRGFRPDGRGHCDHGRAWSIWQIQTGNRGISLTDDGWHPIGDIRGPELVGDNENREAAARVALHMLRQSMRQTGSFCVYTGERCGGPHPHADNHLTKAMEWWRAHQTLFE